MALAHGQSVDSAPVPADVEGAPGSAASARLQILATEHWSLLASRSLAWNESFSRAGMYVSTLSAAMVALALVAQASAFGSAFVLFALVILPLVLFVGVTTFLRLGASNDHDALCVAGMNRIRGAYLEVAPELERYFVMSAHDDARGIAVTMAAPRGSLVPFAHLLAGTPTVVMVLNSVIVGIILAVLALQVTATPLAVGIGIAGFVLSQLGHIAYARRSITQAQASLRPLFPTPPSA